MVLYLHSRQTCVAAPPDNAKSAQAVANLQQWLKESDAPLGKIAEQPFAAVPLAKADAATARGLLWQAHRERIRQERRQEHAQKLITDGDLRMPYDYHVFGKAPATGRSLWISLHGGGGAPPKVNDAQWENQKRLYKLDEGIYLAPRAPTDNWNLWHEPHIDRMFARLIENFIVLADVDPNRVFILGYSAGGDGVYQLAPRMADRWAAASMMAGHPNGVSLLSVRNVPFALQVGERDSAYSRNRVGREYGDKLAEMRTADPGGYEHFVNIRQGKGHWMDGEDAEALPWMAKFTRNPRPQRVVWQQTGHNQRRSYWLAVPPDQVKGDSLVIATRDGQTINLEETKNVKSLLVHVDDQMQDLDQEIRVIHGKQELFRGVVPRTITALAASLAERGDPDLMFAGMIAVEIPPGNLP
ncbi:MAG: hypothetical protein SFX18_16345 [Pirellulales bacterium]|nr:hypothetical protein [Pirellulales bacterium]